MSNVYSRSFETKVDDVSKPRRTVTARINTDDVDRYGTVICPGGGDFRQFSRSPAVLWEHGQDPARGRAPIGHCTSIKYRRGENDLLAVTQFKRDPYSDEIFQDYSNGTLTAWSIDFLPNRSTSSQPTPDELRARPDWSSAKTIYRNWELTGYSAVSYPGNPEALSLAIARGLWVPDEVRAEVARSMAEGSGGSGGFTTEVKDEDTERFIKHEHGKWNVYSEAGKLLGSHDTKDDAVAQLQAIESHKHKKDRSLTDIEYSRLLEQHIRSLFPLLLETQRRIIADTIALDRGQV